MKSYNGILKTTLEYYCRVDNWPRSLVPMIGESVQHAEKYNLSKEKPDYEPDLQEKLMCKDYCTLLVTCGVYTYVYVVI